MRWLVVGVVMSALIGSTALAAPIAAEYFDYGPTVQNLGGLGTAADGWVGPWGDAGILTRPDYGPGANLDLDAKYPSAQYNNSANVGGMAGMFQQVSTGYIIYRDFATPQTGTIWLSAILRYADVSTSTSDSVMLQLHQETLGGNADAVGIYNGRAQMTYRTNSTNSYDATGTEAIASGVYLLLVKVEMNYSGVSDRVAMWIDPNLSNGEVGLGSPTLMRDLSAITGSNKDALGLSLKGVGLSVSSHAGEGLDAIRAGTTLADVTSAPEPATLAMLILGALPMVMRRRHA